MGQGLLGMRSLHAQVGIKLIQACIDDREAEVAISIKWICD